MKQYLKKNNLIPVYRLIAPKLTSKLTVLATAAMCTFSGQNVCKAKSEATYSSGVV